MSSENFLAIVIVLCAASAVLAKPSGQAFESVRDQTICKTKVVFDTNEDRIPRVIKMLKCEDDPDVKKCPVGGKDEGCCSALSLAGVAKFSCTQVQDTVPVMIDGKLHYLTVDIGCSCIKQDPDKAKEIPSAAR